MELLNQPFVWQRSDWPSRLPRWTYDVERLVEPATRVCYLLGKLQAQLEAYGLLDAPMSSGSHNDEALGPTPDMLLEPNTPYLSKGFTYKVQHDEDMWEDRALPLAMEVVASYGIEGINLDLEALKRSVAYSLATTYAGSTPPPITDYQQHLAQLMLQVTGMADPAVMQQPLMQEEFLSWHKALFPFGFSGYVKLDPGQYRKGLHGTMQVVGGALGHERVHYEAPPASDVPAEMDVLFQWLASTGGYGVGNQLSATNGSDASSAGTKPQTSAWVSLLQQGLAHLWFVTVHPFLDGNGRMARLLSLHLLARNHGPVARWLSLAHVIRQQRSQYYEQLQQAQQRGHAHQAPDATSWLHWYLSAMATAAEQALELVATKSRLHKQLAAMRLHAQNQQHELDARQVKLLTLLLTGQKETLRNKKVAAVLNTSQDTALRTLQNMVDLGLLRFQGAGRGAHYVLAEQFSN